MQGLVFITRKYAFYQSVIHSLFIPQYHHVWLTSMFVSKRQRGFNHIVRVQSNMVALRINIKVNINPKDMSSVQDLTNAKASISIPK